MSDAYYIQIDGKKYDRGIIDAARTAHERDGQITKADAETMLEEVKDGNRYTAIEKASVKYVREHYNWTDEADEWFRSAIRKWAAIRGKKNLDPRPATQTTSQPKTVEVKRPATPELSDDEAASHFGELRSLLQKNASSALWDELMAWATAHITVLHREDVETYTKDIVSRWPSTVDRMLSTDMLNAYLFGEEPPQWLVELCDGVIVDQSYMGWSGREKERMQVLCQWKYAKHLDFISLGHAEMECDNIDDALFALGDAKPWRHLKRLHLYGDYMGDEVLEALSRAHFKTLDELKIEGFANFSVPGHEEFRDAKHLPHKIKTMDIYIARTYWDEYFQCWE